MEGFNLGENCCTTVFSPNNAHVSPVPSSACTMHTHPLQTMISPTSKFLKPLHAFSYMYVHFWKITQVSPSLVKVIFKLVLFESIPHVSCRRNRRADQAWIILGCMPRKTICVLQMNLLGKSSIYHLRHMTIGMHMIEIGGIVGRNMHSRKENMI